MAEYFDTEIAAETAVRKCENRPEFYGRIFHSDREKWMIDFKSRDYSRAAFSVLEDLSSTISHIRTQKEPISEKAKEAANTEWKQSSTFSEICETLGDPSPTIQPEKTSGNNNPMVNNGNNLMRFVCPHCKKRIRANTKAIGKQVSCPNPVCKKTIIVTKPTEDIQADTNTESGFHSVYWDDWLSTLCKHAPFLGGGDKFAEKRAEEAIINVGQAVRREHGVAGMQQLIDDTRKKCRGNYTVIDIAWDRNIPEWNAK